MCRRAFRPGVSISGRKSGMHRTYRTQSATGVSTPPTRLDTGPLGPDDSEAVEDEDDDGQDHQHGGDVPGVAEPLEDMLVAGAEAVADAGQRRAPRRTADDGEHGELPQGHLPQTGCQRDERPDQRNEAREQHGPFPSVVEPFLSSIEVLVGEQHELAHPVHQWSAAEVADAVTEERADQLAHRSHHDYQNQAEMIVTG